MESANSQPCADSATITEFIHDIAERYGNSTALVDHNRSLTFQELDAQSDQLARGMQNNGLGSQDTIAIWLDTTADWLLIFLAAAKLGIQVVGINTRFRSEEIGDFIRRCHVTAFFYTGNLHKTDTVSILSQLDDATIEHLRYFIYVGAARQRKLPFDVKTLDYSDLAVAGAPAHKCDDPCAPCIIFTSSGTSSAPKLIRHDQNAVVSHARVVGGPFGYVHGESVVFSLVPAYGVFGMTAIMAGLAAGCTTVIIDTFDPENAADMIAAQKVTHAVGSGKMFELLLADGALRAKLKTLREGAFANFGVDASKLVDTAWSRGIKLFQTYGASELWGLMIYPAQSSDKEDWKLSKGMLVGEQMKFRVRDIDNGQLIEGNEAGELEFAGPNVMMGYLGDPARTKKVLTDDRYYRTGDLGCRDPIASFIYFGRTDQSLRLGGYLVQPREIEEFLERHEEIMLAQVVGIDTEHGQRPFAFVQCAKGMSFDEKRLIAQCKRDMAIYKTPIRIVPLDEFPMQMGSNGAKVQLRELRRLAREIYHDDRAA